KISFILTLCGMSEYFFSFEKYRSNFRNTELLNDPANPLSEAIKTTKLFFMFLFCKSAGNGCFFVFFNRDTLANKSNATNAYGREASATSCALRILVAATNSMALVIFLILPMLLILFFRF